MADKPILSIDFETTGNDAVKDRIVQIGIFDPQKNASLNMLVNPGIPIPAEATECHGISDEDVASAPHFAELAPMILDIIAGHDLVGFNLSNFDVPLLWEELNRCGIQWDTSDVRVIDAGTLFKKREPRTLEAAVEYYLGRKMAGAHDASVDARESYNVYAAQCERYRDFGSLDNAGKATETEYDGAKRLDLAGKIVAGLDGVPRYNFGKAKGDAVTENRGFGFWMLRPDKGFSENTKAVVRGLLYPPKTEPAAVPASEEASS